MGFNSGFKGLTYCIVHLVGITFIAVSRCTDSWTSNLEERESSRPRERKEFIHETRDSFTVTTELRNRSAGHRSQTKKRIVSSQTPTPVLRQTHLPNQWVPTGRFIKLATLLHPLHNLLVTWRTTSLTFNNCTLCPHCIYVFCIYLRTISDLCHLQHKLIGFYNRDEKCLQRGTDWVFK